MEYREVKTLATNPQPPAVIFIVGPTASGKSGLAMKIAQEFDGEIICADSQTVRKGLDIGTAKQTKADQNKTKHHLLDLINPYDRFSAAEFKRAAEKCIKEIQYRGKLPIVVGGTGLYIDALLFDFSFTDKANKKLRAELSTKTVAEMQYLIKSMSLKMPLNKENPRHLIRAIESEGKNATKKERRPDAIIIGIDPGYEELQSRIKLRVADMLESGFVQEVLGVTEEYGDPPDAWDAIGYQIVFKKFVLENEVPDSPYLTEALVVAHRQYAKKQRAWFKRNKEIKWFEQTDEAFRFVQKQLNND